jgi:hypothetical protein
LTQNTLSAPLNIICEGYGCFNKANTKINVKVGQLGTIPLDLCTNCVKKFDGNTSGKADSKQKIVTNEEDKRRYREAVENEQNGKEQQQIESRGQPSAQSTAALSNHIGGT